MFKFKTINRRIMVYLLVPVGLLLLLMGWSGYDLASDHLRKLWAEATTLQLQKAAHQVDMRLNEPKTLINVFAESAGKQGSALAQEIILEQLRNLEGVVRVDISTPDNVATQPTYSPQGMMGRGGESGRGMRFFGDMPIRRKGVIQVTAPVFDTEGNKKTVSLDSEFLDANDNPVGSLNVVIAWSHLIQAVESQGFWETRKVILTDNSGKILACNLPTDRKVLGENGDPLELNTLKAINSKQFGTLIYDEDPLQFSGFYHLDQAPWTLVLIAPGDEVLSPILNFRIYYIVGAVVEFIIILLLIHIVTSKTVASIKEVSDAARKVSRGDYSPHLLVKTKDEMGTLVRDFNTMVVQLEERTRLKTSINLAMEVQQNLLPQDSFRFHGFDIAGKSVYCDETGGDYYDFIYFEDMGESRVVVALGDVSDHGIPSALFMTTARALIRCRAAQGGSPASMVEDVNRLLCDDTQQSGAFMTLFFLLIDSGAKTLSWVRAGHDPALVYDSETGTFDELDGRGLALGVRCQWDYEQSEGPLPKPGSLILLGTDGIWEARNPQGEQFGKERFKECIQKHAHLTSEKIISAIMDDVAIFRQDAPIEDDITLVVVKAEAA